jgi:hypothetical protein
MIDGTKPYKGKPIPKSQTPVERSSEKSSVESRDATETTSPTAAGNATNLERRQWFASLLPAMGEGLVKILRESNNLKYELHEGLKQKTAEISRRDDSTD